MKNKIRIRFRKENGAITVWSALILTAMIGFTALTIDIGLNHYMGAKLQNAVDSAATAVASSLGSVDTSLEDVAYEYLAKNGYDKDDERFNGSLTVDIEERSVADEETMYEGEYITTGYYKITAEVDDRTLLATVLDIDSLHLKKTAYVKCDANYVAMPRALKYTVFGGSTKGTASLPTVDINGRTNSTINSIAGGIQDLINGINSNFIQPIIGIFGGTPNYNDVVHINLSEVITDGDVHSNSNIAIGVQALNVSRVKDRDYDGDTQYNEEAYNTIMVDDEQSYDDYGQVTYTAVDDIAFDNSLKNSGDSKTHVYVQNQQYLEQTQAALNILNTVDFGSTNNLSQLQTAYRDAADKYFQDPAHSLVSSAQQTAIKNQADNLNFGAKTSSYLSFSLIKQSQIVYNVSQAKAENYLDQGEQLGLDGMQELVNTAGVDQLYVDANAASPTMRYANIADVSGSINYGIKFTKDDVDPSISTFPANLTVQGSVVNRDLSHLTGSYGASMSPETYAGARFAVFRTFQENSEYITVPNMKPYFERQVNTSVRSATKSLVEFGADATDHEKMVGEYYLYSTTMPKSVRKAYENDPTNPTSTRLILNSDGTGSYDFFDQGTLPVEWGTASFKINHTSVAATYTFGSEYNLISFEYGGYSFTYKDIFGDRTVKEAVAHLTEKLQTIVDETKYEDETFKYTSDYTRLDTTPLLKYNQTSEAAAATLLTGDARTTLNGYSLFTAPNSQGIQYLKDAATHVEEFKAAEFAEDEDDLTNYGYGAVQKYYNHNIYNSTTDIMKSYAKDAVDRKKASISASSGTSYDAKQTALASDTNFNVPAETGVFLVKNNTNYTPTVEYNNATAAIDNLFGGGSGNGNPYPQYEASTTNTNDIVNRGIWGWNSALNNSDTWQVDIGIKYNTTANTFITALDNYHSSWNTYTASADWDNSPANKIIICNNDGSIRAWQGTEGLRKGDYYKVIEPTDGAVARNRSGIIPKEGTKYSTATGDDWYKVSSAWVSDGSGEHNIQTKGFYIGKSMRFRTPNYMYTQGDKALVQAQNSGLVIDGSDSSGYGLKVDNNWDMYSYSFAAVKSSVYVGTSSKGEGKVTMEDGAIILCDGNMQTKNSITMTTNRGSAGNKNQIIVNGNLTCTDLTLDTQSTVVVRGTLTVTGTLTIPAGAKLSAGTVTATTISLGSTATLIVNDDLNCSDYTVPSGATFYAGNVTSSYNSWLTLTTNKYINGDLSVPGLTVNAGVYLKVNNLTITGSSHRLENSGIIYVTGDLVVEDGLDWFSIINSNKGKIYVGGNVICSQAIAVQGDSDCCFYACGNVEAGNTTADDDSKWDLKKCAKNILFVANNPKVYIGGYLGVNNNAANKQRFIWVSARKSIDDGNNSSTQNAIVSIYGGFRNLDVYNNEQSGSTMYLKGTSSYPLTTTMSSMYTRNWGTIYAYSDLKVASDQVELKNSGKTVVNGNAVFGTATAYTNSILTVSNAHSFYCTGTITAAGIKATNGSKVYGRTGIALKGSYTGGDAGCLTAESDDAAHKSEIFCGPSSTFPSAMGLNINGDIYIKRQNGEAINLKRLGIGKFGKLATTGDLNVRGTGSGSSDQGYFLIDGDEYNKGMLYVGGTTNIEYCRITNYGCMYLMGGYHATNLPSMTNKEELILGTYSDTFIGNNNGSTSSTLATLTLSGHFLGRGNLYIDNNVVISGYTTDGLYKVGDRNTSIVQDGGNTYVSGSFAGGADQAVRINGGGCLSCQKDFTIGSTLYNDGKLIVVDGNLVIASGSTWTTDATMDSPTAKFKYKSGAITFDDNELAVNMGRSIQNVSTNSIIYIGGNGSIKLDGYIENAGQIYAREKFDIRGYYVVESAFYTSERRYTRQRSDLWDSTLALVGQNKNAFRHTPRLSVVNYNNAVMHTGGIDASGGLHNRYNATLSAQNDMKYGMVLLNGGKMVAFGSVGYSSHAYYINHMEVFEKIIGMGDNRTGSYSFINGFCYGDKDNAPPQINRNALFYAGGNLQFGASEDAADDQIAGTVQNWGTMYVDGNLTVYSNKALAYNISALVCQANTNTFINGNAWSSSVIAIMGDSSLGGSIFMCQGDYTAKRASKINISEEFDYNDEFSRCFVYVGGNMYNNTMGISSTDSTNTNDTRDMHVYSNTSIYVGGSFYANSKLYMKNNCTLVVEGQKNLYDTSGNFIQKLIDADRNNVLRTLIQNFLHSDNYRFYVAQCLDVYPNSTIISNGSMFVNDTTKIRDMTKTYIYGNFYCPNYVELGKALDGKDETEAIVSASASERARYHFSRAAYMYVGGNFTSQRYTKIFASSALHVKEDFNTWNYLTLRHDAEIFVGKKLRSGTSIDGGVFSKFRVNGSMEAAGSFIKLRDGCDTFVGGNMTAWSYIELGKFDETIQQGDGARASTITNGVNEGGEDQYEENGSEENPEEGQTETGQGAEAEQEISVNEEAIVDQKTVDTAEELASDNTDYAKGGNFYIGKKLVTYTGYIKEFAYSQVAVGNYVFSPKYITLRSNSDMWVLPPSFENITYEYVPYVAENDGTILGWIKDFALNVANELSNTFLPHNGSIYSLGELTLNKNASLFGTYDCKVLGQCVLRQSSLVYLGHDFDLTAPSLNVSLDVFKGNESVTGFDTYGWASANGYTFPVVVYADNEINIITTMDMKLTYLVANRGNVNLVCIYTKSENAERNAKQLPNAISSYQADVNYNAIYGKIGALFYAPEGNVDIDGYYTEIWGSMLGDRVLFNAYYTALHRFTNWRTMQLNVAESGSVYLISEKEFERAENDLNGMSWYYQFRAKDNPNYVSGDKPFYY